MTIITETGQAAIDAVAYATADQADSYFSARGVAAWAALTAEQKYGALVRGCDYLSQTYRARWAGYRVNDTQALCWPRYMVPRLDVAGYGGYSGEGALIYYASDIVPVEVRNANCEAALRAAAGELLEDVEPTVASETVGPISTTFFNGASKIKKYPAIERILQPLLSSAGGLRMVLA